MDDNTLKRDRDPGGSRDDPGQSSTPKTLTHPISPPRKKRRVPAHAATDEEDEDLRPSSTQPRPPTEVSHTRQSSAAAAAAAQPNNNKERKNTFIRSPFQLTKISDLSESHNRDTVSLGDILGDPLIRECWSFNYLHDVDFTLRAFDEDVRGLVGVHVVHGFWKRDDPRRVGLETAASQHKNVTLHAAYLPEMFGTHHSKMLILFRHDDTAQVVIHTANMIVRDWRNMTQAVWRSPLLPILTNAGAAASNSSPGDERHRPGSGAKFKVDLLSYLGTYDKYRRGTCTSLIEELRKYDFGEVRGALVASVPGRFRVDDEEDDEVTETKWGWAAMRQALREVPLRVSSDGEKKPEVVVQISSIATLGPTDGWLRGTFFRALSGGKRKTRDRQRPREPEFKVVFPTPDEIRRSLDGYGSGGSIHTKIQSPQQAKQLLYLRPMFCHWANDAEGGQKIAKDVPIKDAGRKRAAPHIKTYIRYSDPDPDKAEIDWALVTSANLSKQAWGDSVKKSGTGSSNKGEMRVSSYEIGVLVWPGLFAEGAVMRATFMADEVPEEKEDENAERTVVALRVPYSLPLQGYAKDEVPWVATAEYTEPDWMGEVWKDD
ncbi:tyrosyl-DNA phosphodiesterase-domain-containing protein [Echria macrotheca]|uniref:Tyrosyl-DNA phosphodiesterase-domain-containing protein n=1 Tax=Echria macrotheca TaxID=438768 RepID=A0AAJ0F291_9PEZI|nr:tyrosyl-DNA phosphodiesterase-domain-containing protein [Echria macrotheca]